MAKVHPSTLAISVELAQKGFYDNLKFHRYVPGFVIQGGDPNTRDLDSEQVKAAEGNPFAGLGTGGPGYTIKEEFSTNPNNEHLDGTLAMARSQDPNSAGSQFYLCLGPQPFLDSGYTVFGQTVDGLDVISKLLRGRRDRNDHDRKRRLVGLNYEQ